MKSPRTAPKKKAPRSLPDEIIAASEAPATSSDCAPERQQLIAAAAYYRAEQRGFVAGYELDDWLAAEREVDQRLRNTPTISA